MLVDMAKKITCTHKDRLTRTEAAEHVGCTEYGRTVNPRTIDRWADDGLITRYKQGGLQWVRYNRDEITEAVRVTRRTCDVVTQ